MGPTGACRLFHSGSDFVNGSKDTCRNSYSQSRALRNRHIKKRSPAKWTLQIRNAAHWSAPAPKKRFQSVTLHVYVSSDRPTGAQSSGRRPPADSHPARARRELRQPCRGTWAPPCWSSRRRGDHKGELPTDGKLPVTWLETARSRSPAAGQDLRNGAAGRAAAEETLRNGAWAPKSCFLNARD